MKMPTQNQSFHCDFLVALQGIQMFKRETAKHRFMWPQFGIVNLSLKF